MSSEDVRKVSVQDIQLVQNLIERCLQLYMSPKEVVNTLLHQAKIEPGFTELVWQKLVAENPEFFRAYHLRLIVKDQIIRFNHLLEEQVELMGRVSQTGAASISRSNGSQFHSLHNTSPYRAPQFDGPPIKTENTHQLNGSLLNLYTNGEHTFQPFARVGLDMVDRADLSEDMVFARNSDMGMVQRTNGGAVIKSEPVYEISSAFVFGGDENVLESHDAIGAAPVSPFNGDNGPSPPVLSETVLEPGTSSFGFLGQIPRNFSLSDLTADFSSSTEILESYPGSSPYMGRGASLPEPHIKDEQEDIKRRDGISESLEL